MLNFDAVKDSAMHEKKMTAKTSNSSEVQGGNIRSLRCQCCALNCCASVPCKGRSSPGLHIGSGIRRQTFRAAELTDGGILTGRRLFKVQFQSSKLLSC